MGPQISCNNLQHALLDSGMSLICWISPRDYSTRPSFPHVRVRSSTRLSAGFFAVTNQGTTSDSEKIHEVFPVLVICGSKMIQVAIASFSFTFAKHIPTRFSMSSVVRADLTTCLAWTRISEAKLYKASAEQVLFSKAQSIEHCYIFSGSSFALELRPALHCLCASCHAGREMRKDEKNLAMLTL